MNRKIMQVVFIENQKKYIPLSHIQQLLTQLFITTMRIFKRLAIVIALVAAVALPSSAQFRFGIKAGFAANSLKLNESVFDSSNRMGFTGGVMAEFNVPIVNLGFDASVLYARRSIELSQTVNGISNTFTDNRNYIDIPVNLKWKIGLPIVGKFISPFITTGPDFSFLISGKNMENAWKNKTFDCAWTVGAGIQLLNHLQVGATYGFGLTKSAASTTGTDALYNGKNRCWTVTAAYLF